MENKEYEAFLKWHFDNWKLNCAHSDSVDEAKKIYERIYQNDKPIHVAERERGFMAWKAGVAQAVPDTHIIVPRVPTEKMLSAGCSSISYGMTNEKNSERIFKAMINASESGVANE